MGDQCPRCHEHPIDDRHPQDFRWQRLQKNERKRIRENMDPEKERWKKALMPMLRAVEEDAQMFLYVPEPLGDTHTFILGVHRGYEQISPAGAGLSVGASP